MTHAPLPEIASLLPHAETPKSARFDLATPRTTAMGGRGPNARAAAALVLVAEGGPRVLMGRRPACAPVMPGKTVFPGGLFCAADTDRAACAVRETREETGLAVTAPLTPLARVITPPDRTARFDAWFYFAHADAALLAQPLAGDGELEALGWRTPAEALAEDLAAVTAFVLDRALARLNDPASRALTLIEVDGAARVAPFDPDAEANSAAPLAAAASASP